MKHVFPHAEVAPLEIPDGQLSGLYSMRAAGAAVDPRQLIAVALAHSIGSARLRRWRWPSGNTARALESMFSTRRRN